MNNPTVPTTPIDLSHQGLYRSITDYTNSQISAQVDLERRLSNVLSAVSPQGMKNIDNFLVGPDTASAPPVEQSLTAAVGNLPTLNKRTFLMLEALENALLLPVSEPIGNATLFANNPR
jgi:hypothetical protein